jgi:quercetin dioxygenase-like cupin family protein
MRSWDLTALEARPHKPLIVSSTPAGRVLALTLPAGEALGDHEVHEHAWLVILAGEVEVSSGDDEGVTGSPGALFEFAAQERREVHARSDARMLLLLAPWPGDGHPGALSLAEKATARLHAAAHVHPVTDSR